MPRAYLPLLLLLTAAWGASYMFIKVAVRDFEPTAMMDLRLWLAAAALLAFLTARLGARGAAAELRATGVHGLVLGVVNMALPFTLIAWGEKHVDSGVAAIANSTVPIFVALLAIRFRPSERVGGSRLVGVLLGLVGVGVLAGIDTSGGWWAVAGTLAVVLSSVCYATGGLYGQHAVSEASGIVLGTASAIVGAVVLLPLALFQLPSEAPGWKALGSVAALALLGTALAQIVLFRMLASFGPSRTSLVTYLLPIAALGFGIALLGEAPRLSELLGLVLILGGVALGSGAVRLARRAPVTAAP